MFINNDFKNNNNIKNTLPPKMFVNNNINKIMCTEDVC